MSKNVYRFMDPFWQPVQKRFKNRYDDDNEWNVCSDTDQYLDEGDIYKQDSKKIIQEPITSENQATE